MTFREHHIRAWREALQPLVSQSLRQLTAQHWDQLRSGTVSRETQGIVTSMCRDILCLMASLISELCIESLQAEYGTPAPDPPKGSAEPSQLCDTIINTFLQVNCSSPDMQCNSTEEVVMLVNQEITDRLNMRLHKFLYGQNQSSSGKPEKPLESRVSKTRLQTIVTHVVSILKTYVHCAASPATALQPAETASTKLLSDDQTPRDEALHTPVTPFERQEPLEAPGGWASTATEAVKVVLEEVAQTINSVGPLHGFSVEERDLVQSSFSYDSTKTASDIVHSAMEELKAEPEPKTKTSCCQREARKIQAFCAQRFAWNSIFSFVSELKKKYCCGQSESRGTSVSALLDGVDWALEDVIPMGPDQGPSEASLMGGDLFQTIADNISGDLEKVVSKRLNSVVWDHIGPDPEHKLEVQSELQASVDTFLQRLKMWLQRQVWLKKSGRDAATEALQKVEEVLVNLAANTEASSPPEGDTVETASVEAAASPRKESATGKEVTEPGADPKTSPWWNVENYKILVMALVDDITKGMAPHMIQNNLEIITVLTQKLCAAMAGCDVSVKPKERDIKRIVKAVKKELTKQWGNKWMVQSYLLTSEDQMHHDVVNMVKKQLTAPKKKSFFSSFFSCLRLKK